MKLKFLILSILLLSLSVFSFGCSNSTQQEPPQENYITLDESNATYYFSVNNVLTDERYLASRYFYDYSLTITGAVNGMYIDCSVTIKYGSTEKIIDVNAAGYAQLSYTTQGGTAQIINASGKIKL